MTDDVAPVLTMQAVIRLDLMVDVVLVMGMSLIVCCMCDACGAPMFDKANIDDWSDTAAPHPSSEYYIILTSTISFSQDLAALRPMVARMAALMLLRLLLPLISRRIPLPRVW